MALIMLLLGPFLAARELLWHVGEAEKNFHFCFSREGGNPKINKTDLELRTGFDPFMIG